MAKNVQPPADFKIAALKHKQAEYRNPMEPGRGTPWEDRGSAGMFLAFVRTCWMSLRQPMALFDDIRRVDTDRDALRFAIGCGLAVGLSWFIHSTIHFYRYEGGITDVVTKQNYFIGSVLQWLISPVLVIGLVKLCTAIYCKLVAPDVKIKAPPVLTFNVFAYALGPSILALVPFIGPPVAVIWIAVLMAAGTVRRQQISVKGAAVAAVLTMLAVVAVSAGVYLLGWMLWRQVVYFEVPNSVRYSR